MSRQWFVQVFVWASRFVFGVTDGVKVTMTSVVTYFNWTVVFEWHFDVTPRMDTRRHVFESDRSICS